MYANSHSKRSDIEDHLRGLILKNQSCMQKNIQKPYREPSDSRTRTKNSSDFKADNSDLTYASLAKERVRSNKVQYQQSNFRAIPSESWPLVGNSGSESMSTGPSNSWRVEPIQHQSCIGAHQLIYQTQNINSETPSCPIDLKSRSSPRSPIYVHCKPDANIQQEHSNRGISLPQNPPQANSTLNNFGTQNRTRRLSTEIKAQTMYLQNLVESTLPNVLIDPREVVEKETFREEIELRCQEAIVRYHRKLLNFKFKSSDVELRCFGSMMTGFATKSSDMDLALILSNPGSETELKTSVIPRLLEKTLLDLGYGARLLDRALVPIIKVCEKPSSKLLLDLRVERAIWENGVDNCQEQDEAMIHTDSILDKERWSANAGSESTLRDIENANKTSYQVILASLKQKKEQSLDDYCKTAKRYLRDLGGRDIFANAPELDVEEVSILKNVCKAFLLGIFSSVLSLGVRKHNSTRLLSLDKSLLPHLSLQALCSQLEGEQLVAMWNFRPLPEASVKQELEARAYIQAWISFRDVKVSALEIPAYTRQLHLHCKNLRNIPSLQLVFLEQTKYDDPLAYYGKAHSIMEKLQPEDQSYADTLTSVVVSHYISGIKSEQIREFLQDLDRRDIDLQQIGLQHRILQLIDDYERALDLGIYADYNQELVKQFISILKSLRLNYLYLPQDPRTACLVTKLRSYPDPTRVLHNKSQDGHSDHLRFPKTNIGVQCDINFSAEFAIFNTHLLRCYCSCDPRVKEMVLFIKHWARVREINSPYQGSLSSYGYVLMVLHYLINIAQPFVCPNLQAVKLGDSQRSPNSDMRAISVCKEKGIWFWGDERQIMKLSEQNKLNHNQEPVGMLLRGFYEYFAKNGQGHGFDWSRDVLSIRKIGGIMSKVEKSWTYAKTVVLKRVTTLPSVNNPSAEGVSDNSGDVKLNGTTAVTKEETREIRHRYLLAIEDPFELEHNVARTVTHDGIVSIRNEFRRAWKIIKDVTNPIKSNEELLDHPSNKDLEQSSLDDILRLITSPV